MVAHGATRRPYGGAVAVEQSGPPFDKVGAASGAGLADRSPEHDHRNEADDDGGGIAMYPGSGGLVVDNSTIVDNNANDGDGGGIDICQLVPRCGEAGGHERYEVDNSTIAGNDARAATASGGVASPPTRTSR